MIRLMVLKEACASVAIETGQNPRELFHRFLMNEAGISKKQQDKILKGILKGEEAMK